MIDLSNARVVSWPVAYLDGQSSRARIVAWRENPGEAFAHAAYLSNPGQVIYTPEAVIAGFNDIKVLDEFPKPSIEEELEGAEAFFATSPTGNRHIAVAYGETEWLPLPIGVVNGRDLRPIEAFDGWTDIVPLVARGEK